MLEKLPPNNTEAERAILGAVLLNDKAFYMANAAIQPSEFYLEAHRHIFGAMQNLKASESPIDMITLITELRRREILEICGGAAYISSLTEGIPNSLNIEPYAKIVRDTAKLRDVIQITNEATLQCMEPSADVDGLIQNIKDRLRGVSFLESKGFYDGLTAITDTYKQIEKNFNTKKVVTGVPSGFSKLDHLTGGFQPGDMDIIAARTGAGKTAMALNILNYSILHHHSKAIIFSLEMKKEQLLTRMISSESSVPAWSLKTGHIVGDDWDKITDTTGKIGSCSFWVYDQSIELAKMEEIIQQTVETNGAIDLIIVDYLQLVHLGKKRAENRTQEVTEVSRGLKRIATDFNVPVIALSQLNQEGLVRESRAIEQDASLLMVIEMDYDKLKTEELVPAKLQVNKNRNGSLGSIELQYRKSVTRFEQID